MDFEKTIVQIQDQAILEFKEIHHSRDVETLKIKYLGKKGILQGLMHSLRECSPAERPRAGKLVNDLKEQLEARLNSILTHLEANELNHRLLNEKIDITLPGNRNPIGRRHVVLKMLDEALDILIGMGFSVEYGPDIETDYYNFEALNFAKDHPARDMQDTFYITSDLLLRTHTSNTQVRTMERFAPPIRIVAPGSCFRNEDITPRSHIVFHQIEGLYIDKDVTFSDLLATLEEFFSKFFNSQVKMRYRPSYFPFVEPGMEVDVQCLNCDGGGCGTCKYTGWLEVAGAGMVHPEVLKNGGIDPEKFLGYAWGFGIERLALLRYSIKDIRLFTENHMKFLQQF